MADGWSSSFRAQPCLGGSGKTLMFVNVNPEPASAQETLCSLRFAAKVNACETGAKGGAKQHVQHVSGSSAAEASGGGGSAAAQVCTHNCDTMACFISLPSFLFCRWSA